MAGWLAACLLAWPAAAQAGDFEQHLFDGSSLDRLVVEHCEAKVVDGNLRIVDGNGWVRSHHQYRDFVLQLSYRPLKEAHWDSGIFFRSPQPAQGPWPKRYQVNLKQGQEGNLIGFPAAVSKGLTRPGWNQLKLTVQGDTAALEINGQPAWKVAGVAEQTGYVAIQVEVPEGGQFDFRDITIRELGHRSLFNGKDLGSWQGAQAAADSCWMVERGLLKCTGEKGTWLRSAEQFGDFNLRLEYRLKEGGNSGVYIRVPEDGNHHGKDAGIEVQVLDDAAKRYAKLKPYQYSASLYAIVPANPRVARPAGQWNSLEIDCRGHHYSVYQNGVRVIHANISDAPQLAERLQQGYLGLQNHSEEVWFRDLRIGGSLAADAPADASTERPEEAAAKPEPR